MFLVSKSEIRGREKLIFTLDRRVEVSAFLFGVAGSDLTDTLADRCSLGNCTLELFRLLEVVYFGSVLTVSGMFAFSFSASLYRVILPLDALSAVSTFAFLLSCRLGFSSSTEHDKKNQSQF